MMRRTMDFKMLQRVSMENSEDFTKAVADIFELIDARFSGQWDIDFQDVDTNCRQLHDNYWTRQHRDGHGGLVRLLAPGPSEYVRRIQEVAINQKLKNERARFHKRWRS